jgi:hypothetical protein
MVVRCLFAALLLALLSVAAVGQTQDTSDPKHPPNDAKPGDGKLLAGPEPDPQGVKFKAPKTQVWRLVIDGVLGSRSWGTLETVTAILVAALGLFAMPCVLAWNYAKGSGRNAWVWLFFALVTSWFVIPIIWVTSAIADRSSRYDKVA